MHCDISEHGLDEAREWPLKGAGVDGRGALDLCHDRAAIDRALRNDIRFHLFISCIPPSLFIKPVHEEGHTEVCASLRPQVLQLPTLSPNVQSFSTQQ